jgi:hypothetical protein
MDIALSFSRYCETLVSRYSSLTEHLSGEEEDVVVLTFAQLDEIVDILPPSARRYAAWWANSSNSAHQSKYWLDAGRRAKPEIAEERVRFSRTRALGDTDDSARPPRAAGRKRSPARREEDAVRTRKPVDLVPTGEVARATLIYEWMSAGEIALGGEKLDMPLLQGRPGVFRFRIRSTSGSVSSYVGETENLASQMNHFRHPSPSQLTNIRLNEILSKTLSAGGAAHLEVTVAGLMSGEALDLSQRSARILIENAALYDLHRRGDVVEDH